MPTIQPLKIEDGEFKTFTKSDDLPNQIDINELQDILGIIVLELMAMGIQFQNTKIQKLINSIKNY